MNKQKQKRIKQRQKLRNERDSAAITERSLRASGFEALANAYREIAIEKSNEVKFINSYRPPKRKTRQDFYREAEVSHTEEYFGEEVVELFH